MRKILFVALACAAAMAQAQPKQAVIGLLWNDPVKPSPHASILLEGLRERGYQAGGNLRIEDRIAAEGYSPMADGAAALVRAKVDLIVTYGRTATLAAAKATREIPIVAVIGTDPVALGLAASLSRPGGNVTGVATLSGEVSGKRMELLKELVPGLTSVGLLVAGDAAGFSEISKKMNATAKVLNLKLHIAAPRSAAEIDAAVAELAKARVGGLSVSGNTLLGSNSERVVAAVARHRIPAVYAMERSIDAGGLVAYYASADKAFKRAANYVDRILKGARAGELPIEQMEVFELAVNLKTARSQGIKIPQVIVLRANRVIE